MERIMIYLRMHILCAYSPVISLTFNKKKISSDMIHCNVRIFDRICICSCVFEITAPFLFVRLFFFFFLFSAEYVIVFSHPFSSQIVPNRWFLDQFLVYVYTRCGLNLALIRVKREETERFSVITCICSFSSMHSVGIYLGSNRSSEGHVGEPSTSSNMSNGLVAAANPASGTPSNSNSSSRRTNSGPLFYLPCGTSPSTRPLCC